MGAAIRTARESGSVIVVAGEAGIGKSRVSAEAIVIAKELGAIALLGNCSERAHAAYAPVVSALRSYLHAADSAEAERLFSGPARLAGTLLPDVARALNIAMTAGQPAAEHLFAALWHVFRRLGERRPTVLLVEDVHWADQDTLDLLMYVAREAPELGLCLVLTARPDELRSGHPLVPVLSSLRRLSWVTEIPLHPLRRAGVEQMLTALLDTTVAPALVDAMVERTGGVPYFIEELCASLDVKSLGANASATFATPLTPALPLSLRDALLSRLKSLGWEQLRLLQVAAVAGERVDRRLLAAAAATDLDRVDEIVDAGVRLHVLVEVIEAGAPRHYFRHALMRDALIAELPSRDARDAHRRVAGALRSRYADTAAIAAVLSQHYQEADEPAEALPFELEAARYASGRVAPAETLVHFETALRLAAQVGADELPILLDAADAAITTYGAPLEGGLALARRARSLARDRGAPIEEARALNLISTQVWKDGRFDEAIGLSEAALDLVAGRDDAAEAAAIARIVSHLATAGHRERMPALIARGTALASASENLRALAKLQKVSGLCADDSVTAEEAFTSSIRTARTAGDVELEAEVLSDASYTALLHGRLRRAREAGERALALLGAAGDRPPFIVMLLAYVEALSGDLDGALGRVRSVSPQTLEQASAQTRTLALHALSEIQRRRGDRRAALDTAESARRLAEETGTAWQFTGIIEVCVHFALDDGAAEAGIACFLDGSWPPVWQHSPDVARHLALRHDTTLRRFVDRVEEWTASRAMTVSRGPGAIAARDFCRGLLALQQGDVNAAGTLLAASAARFSELPTPARQAEALIALAQANVMAGQRRRAVTTLLEAREIARALTASALEREVAAAMGELGVRMPRETARMQPGGLSAKEAEVAALIAAGSTNADIAARLVASPRTVANHVSNILAKLELHNRSEVARWAMAHGLAAPARRAAVPPSGEPQRLTVLKIAAARRTR